MKTYKITQKVKSLTGTKKHSFTVCPYGSITPQGGWSGGSRSYYDTHCFKPSEMKEFLLEIGDQFSKVPKRQEIPPGWIVIETGVFVGKPSRPRIICREDELEAVLEYLGNPVLERERI